MGVFPAMRRGHARMQDQRADRRAEEADENDKPEPGAAHADDVLPLKR